MPGSHTIPSDDSGLDRYIGIILRTGMLLSASMVLIGSVLFLTQHGLGKPDFHEFRGEPKHMTSVRMIVQDAAHGQPLSIIQLGLLLLIVTPIARVVFSVAAFAWERDYLYVGFSLTVLLVLLYSLLGFKDG